MANHSCHLLASRFRREEKNFMEMRGVRYGYIPTSSKKKKWNKFVFISPFLILVREEMDFGNLDR